MKVECTKEKIKNGIAHAERVTGKNLALPILSAILIESTDDGRLVLSATNLDMGIEVAVPARVSRPGKVAVSGSLINNFLSHLSDEDVVGMELVGENLSVSTERNVALVKSFSSGDFPSIPRFSVERAFEISAESFREGLRSVAYAASLSDIKPELSSVCILLRSGEIVFAATDSFRLAEKRIPFKGTPEGFSLLIPHKNALEMSRILDGVSGPISIGFDKNQVALLGGGSYVVSRLVGGVFPDYAQIVPRSKETEAVLLKKDLLSALKLTSIFSDKFNRVTFRAHPKDGIFEIESRNSDRGENTTQVASTLEGNPVELAFNGRYLLDALQSVPEDSVSLSFSGQGKPLVMRGVGGPSFLYLVMPLNN